MSGVYIKNMEMPKRCLDCPFMVSREHDDCILQSDEANASFYEWDDMKKNCPLVPVPDHGRLIDADDFFSSFSELRPYDFVAPTIIPADTVKEE